MIFIEYDLSITVQKRPYFCYFGNFKPCYIDLKIIYCLTKTPPPLKKFQKSFLKKFSKGPLLGGTSHSKIIPPPPCTPMFKIKKNHTYQQFRWCTIIKAQVYDAFSHRVRNIVSDQNRTGRFNNWSQNVSVPQTKNFWAHRRTKCIRHIVSAHAKSKNKRQHKTSYYRP